MAWKILALSTAVKVVKQFLFNRREKAAEKIVDSVLDALEKGAEKTQFTTLDDRAVKYIKAERKILIKLVEEKLSGVLK